MILLLTSSSEIQIETKPATRVKSGPRLSIAVPPNTVVLPGSTVFASEALGTYSGSGTVLHKKPAEFLLEIHPNLLEERLKLTLRSKQSHRDPLHSHSPLMVKVHSRLIDLYFATKDPGAKVFVELRTMNLNSNFLLGSRLYQHH